MALPIKNTKINIIEGIDTFYNGGKGSGNFGHAGRPGERGGSSSGGGVYIPKHQKESRIRDAIAKSIIGQKKLQDQAKIVQEDIEDRIGQKVKEGEEYTALDEAMKSRFKYFHGEDGTEYTYDKGNGMITKTNPKTGDQEIVTKQKDGGGEYEKRKDYKAEQEGVDARDGYRIGTEFADLERELGNARTNLKVLKKDKETAYTDLAARSRYLDRSSAIARTLAQATNFGKASKETKKLVREMAEELKDIYDEYVELGTKKYFDPDLNHEN